MPPRASESQSISAIAYRVLIRVVAFVPFALSTFSYFRVLNLPGRLPQAAIAPSYRKVEGESGHVWRTLFQAKEGGTMNRGSTNVTVQEVGDRLVIR